MSARKLVSQDSCREAARPVNQRRRAKHTGATVGMWIVGYMYENKVKLSFASPNKFESFSRV